MPATSAHHSGLSGSDAHSWPCRRPWRCAFAGAALGVSKLLLARHGLTRELRSSCGAAAGKRAAPRARETREIARACALGRETESTSGAADQGRPDDNRSVAMRWGSRRKSEEIVALATRPIRRLRRRRYITPHDFPLPVHAGSPVPPGVSLHCSDKLLPLLSGAVPMNLAELVLSTNGIVESHVANGVSGAAGLCGAGRSPFRGPTEGVAGVSGDDAEHRRPSTSAPGPPGRPIPPRARTSARRSGLPPTSGAIASRGWEASRRRTGSDSRG
jgi:hypothetical protein